MSAFALNVKSPAHRNRGQRLSRSMFLAVLLATRLSSSGYPGPYLVRDINQRPTPVGSDLGKEFAYDAPPVGFVSLDGVIYFEADDGIHGRELWRSDGTTLGTWLVSDVFPGRSDSTGGACSVNSDIEVMGSDLFFIANDGVHGLELWKSDGTQSGTAIVKDIHPGPQDSCPFDLKSVGGVLYFAADDGVHGSELWRSNGTEEGTFLVLDLELKGTSIGNYYFHASSTLFDVNGVVAFVVNRNYEKGELWRSDGTSDGTYPILDSEAFPNAWSVSRRHLCIVGEGLYVFTKGDVLGVELWRTDGTVEGTIQVAVLGCGDLYDSSTTLAAFDNRLYFGFGSVASGGGLWTSDGTAAGTFLVRGDLGVDQLTPTDDLLYFLSGGDLWRSDGTEKGTFELLDSGSIRALTAHADQLAFSVWRSDTGAELWTSDGSLKGTRRVVDLNPGSGHGIDRWEPIMQAVDGFLFFNGDDGTTGPELWKSDGTPDGTELVKNIRFDVGSSGPWQFRNVASKLYFAADDGQSGVELWIRDHDGTRQVRDIREGPFGSIGTTSSERYFDTLLFSAQDGVHGLELWRSDGTEQGTNLVRDISGDPRNFTRAGRQLFFTIHGPGPGQSYLWRSDGSEGGTRPVVDIPPWDSGITPQASLDDVLLFNARLAGGDWAAWSTDGTPEGTEVFLPGFGWNYTPAFARDGGWQVFYYAQRADTGTELWRTDGTVKGTGIVKDIAPGPASVIPPVSWYPEWATIGNTLYFLADNTVIGLELWRSNGTQAGTELVSDILDGEQSAFEPLRELPFEPVTMSDQLYFAANDGIHGRELWRSDGTADGTYMVVDIAAGPESSMPNSLTTASPCGPLYFAAYTEDRGMEVWRSDGTKAGTYRVSDIGSGYLGSSPRDLLVVGATLYFAASDADVGEELWALDIAHDIVIGDNDCDGATTLTDVSAFIPCWTGVDDWTRPWCIWADFDQDDTVDLYDAALLQAGFGR